MIELKKLIRNILYIRVPSYFLRYIAETHSNQDFRWSLEILPILRNELAIIPLLTITVLVSYKVND